MQTIPIPGPYELTSTRYGPMLVNPCDWYMGASFLKYGEACQREIDFLLPLLQAPGLVIEVGANMGVHTIPLALELSRRSRSILVFEPQPVVFQQLCANLSLNGLLNVTAWPFACGNEQGSVAFTAPDYEVSGNFGAVEMTIVSTEADDDSLATSAGVTQVLCFPLDRFAAQEDEVALIKIDVEGQELAVLQGAQRTLARSRPLLYVENDRAHASKGLIQWLLARDYRLWWHTPRLFNSRNLRGIADNVYGHTLSVNMLCVPTERECPVQDLEEIFAPCVHPVVLRASRRR